MIITLQSIKNYGLPETYKLGISLWPIISGIGSTTHNIAESLTKMLSPLLGNISNSHKNSYDLQKKKKNQ